MAATLDPSLGSDVFSLDEVARAAGVELERVRALVDSHAVRTFGRGFFSSADAIRAVQLLRQDDNRSSNRRLFQPGRGTARPPALPFLASGGIHVAIAASLALLTTIGVTSHPAPAPATRTRLVFLAGAAADCSSQSRLERLS
jgi:hypothetical protein